MRTALLAPARKAITPSLPLLFYVVRVRFFGRSSAAKSSKIHATLGLQCIQCQTTISRGPLCTTAKLGRSMSESGLGRAKTKSDLIVMPSGRQIFCVFLLSARPQGPKFQVRLYRVEFSHSQGQNPNPPLGPLCRLPPAADIQSHRVRTG